MKITLSYLYLSLLLCLLSYATLDAQEAFNDSVALIKRNYINATVGKDKGKEVLLRQLSTIPPEKEASDQNVIELQQLYPISPKEIKHLINTLHTDGSWEDINLSLIHISKHFPACYSMSLVWQVSYSAYSTFIGW